MGNGHWGDAYAVYRYDDLLTPHGERSPADRHGAGERDRLLTPHGERSQEPMCGYDLIVAGS